MLRRCDLPIRQPLRALPTIRGAPGTRKGESGGGPVTRSIYYKIAAPMSAIHFLPRLFLLEIELLLAQAVAEVRWVQAIADDLRAGRLTWNKAWVKKAVKELGEQHFDEGTAQVIGSKLSRTLRS
jgi:hypothetical protein